MHSVLSRSRTWMPIVGILALLVGAPLARTLWDALTPETHDGKTVMLVNGKKRTYWRAKKGVEQVLQVQGPATVRLVSRVPWSSRYAGQEYLLEWAIDGGAKGSFREEIRKASGAVRESDNKKLSRGGTHEIEVPAGKQVLRLKLAESPGTVAYLRYHARNQDPPVTSRNVDLRPVERVTPRRVKAGETIVDYYPLASGGEMSVELEGPGYLKVISRLDWNETMTASQKYTLKIFEDGLIKQSYVLKGNRSETATYLGKDDTVPAQGEVVFLEVPEGKHRYTVGFQETGREVNLRFLAPAPGGGKKSKGKG